MKKISLVINIFFIIAFFPAAAAAIVSPMLFDSGETSRTWTIFWTSILIPVSILITQIISWILYKKKNYTSAAWVSLIPLVFIFFLFFLFIKSNSLTD